jgi:rRNA maturation endonuclease Nob1
MKKTGIIDALKNRIDALEKWQKGKAGNKKKELEDEDVCPVCGSDLLFIEEGIVYCKKCDQYYEPGEEEDK